MQSLPIDHLLKRIRQLQTPALIAIAGYGGAGKTTLAQQLADALPSSYVVHLDDFLIKDRMADVSADMWVFDRARLEAQVLKPLSRRQAASYQRLDLPSNVLGEPTPIPPVDYCIVEGVSSYHPHLSHYYDLKIWIELPMATAHRRGRARDRNLDHAHLWKIWMANDSAYREKYRPDAAADFIFNNARDVL
jgi:uridine kinase